MADTMTPTDDRTDTRMTLRGLLRVLSIAWAVALVLVCIAGFALGTTPFPGFYIAIVLSGVAAWWLGAKAGKGPVIFTLVVALLNILGMWWLVFSLFQYTSPVEFTLGAGFVLFVLPALVIAILALVRPAGSGAAAFQVIRVLTVVAIVVGAVGAVTAPDDAKQSGDIELVAKNFEFEQDTLTADAGEFTIWLNNKDVLAHDVAIKTDDGAVDKKGELAPGNKAARSTFADVSAGSYEFYCSIHPDMNGTLTVS